MENFANKLKIHTEHVAKMGGFVQLKKRQNKHSLCHY